MTQGGSRPDEGEERLLAVMGQRGGWNVDALCEATGLAAQAASVALLTCELAGRVKRDAGGRYRVADPG